MSSQVKNITVPENTFLYADLSECYLAIGGSTYSANTRFFNLGWKRVNSTTIQIDMYSTYSSTSHTGTVTFTFKYY